MKHFDIGIPDCKRFNGYKPCEPMKVCEATCSEYPIGTKILIVSLGAMGAVLQTTAMLAGLKRKYPVSTITWITFANAQKLLEHNPLIDKIVVWSDDTRMILQQQTFDVVLNPDKSVESSAFTNSLVANEKLGFGLNENGKIIPLNAEAVYQYKLGIDDHLKFKVNTRSGQDIMAETLKVPYERDDYILSLTADELAFTRSYKEESGIKSTDIVIGFNTGCSELFPNKKLSIEQHIDLITRFSKLDDVKVLLLGGKEDTDRNRKISDAVGYKAISTPTTEGLRKGIALMNAADVIITGDTFGMHCAIALKKYVVAWYGLSCQVEIDLYDRGIKIYQPDLACSPCWQKQCPKDGDEYLKCISGLDMTTFYNAVTSYIAKKKKLIPA